MKRIRLSWLLLAIAATGFAILFGRELVSLGSIAISRAVDKGEEAILSPILTRDYQEIVQANTEQALEIEQYLGRLDHPESRTPEVLGLNFASEAGYLQSCEKIRSLLASSLGYPPPETAPPARQDPNVVRIAEDELATYYEFSAPVFQNVHARGLFMMPRSGSGKVPLIIAVAGRGGMPAQSKSGKLTVVGRSNRDLARGALEKGYAVWEPILIFYAQDRPDDIRDRLEVRAREYGTTLPAIEILKIRRGLDALIKTQPIDATRIAMVGMSYGGFYTLYTTALDDRIRVAVVASYFNDRRAILDAAEPFGMPDWRFPNSLGIFQDPTLAALICPRPLQIQAGDHDQLFPIAGVRKTIPSVKDIYRRLDIAGRFSFEEFVGRHDFNGDAAWKFVERAFE